MAALSPHILLPPGTQELLQQARRPAGISQGLLALVRSEDLLAASHGPHGSRLDPAEVMLLVLRNTPDQTQQFLARP